jgi:hypothetical protein
VGPILSDVGVDPTATNDLRRAGSFHVASAIGVAHDVLGSSHIDARQKKPGIVFSPASAGFCSTAGATCGWSWLERGTEIVDGNLAYDPGGVGSLVSVPDLPVQQDWTSPRERPQRVIIFGSPSYL